MLCIGVNRFLSIVIISEPILFAFESILGPIFAGLDRFRTDPPHTEAVSVCFRFGTKKNSRAEPDSRVPEKEYQRDRQQVSARVYPKWNVKKPTVAL